MYCETCFLTGHRGQTSKSDVVSRDDEVNVVLYDGSLSIEELEGAERATAIARDTKTNNGAGTTSSCLYSNPQN